LSLNVTTHAVTDLLHTTTVDFIFLGGIVMVKRKVAYKAATNNNKTPKESLPEGEFAMEYANENVAKYANRNSKKGKQNT
jgi:hypothetical protein